MSEFVKLLLSLSVSGTLLLLMMLALKRMYRKRFSRRWQYYIWIVAALRFLLPFTPDNAVAGMLFEPSDPAVLMSAGAADSDVTAVAGAGGGDSATAAVGTGSGDNTTAVVGTSGGDSATAAADKNEHTAAPVRNPQSIDRMLFPVWAAVALILFLRRIMRYRTFIRHLGAGSTEISDLRTQNLLSDCQKKLRIRTGVTVSRNPLIASPVA